MAGSRAEATTYAGDLGSSSSKFLRGHYADGFHFDPAGGADQYSIEVSSPEFDTYLAVISPDGTTYVNDDYEGSTQRSFLRLPRDVRGAWTLLVTSYNRRAKGAYTITVRPKGDLKRLQTWALDAKLFAEVFDRIQSVGVEKEMTAVRETSAPTEMAGANEMAEVGVSTIGAIKGMQSASAPRVPEGFALFPWPPPHASAIKVLPRSLVIGDGDEEPTLHHVDTRLSAALQAAGYHDKSYYGVPDGFALVTRLERIDGDGAPLGGVARWVTEIPAIHRFSLREYVRALFGARVGYFRLLVFIVTSHPFVQSDEETRLRTANRWLHQGANLIPESIAAKPYTPRHQTTVLVYEFEKVRASSVTQVRVPGRFDCENHLQRSGILSQLEE